MIIAMRMLLDAARALVADFEVYDIGELLEQTDGALYGEVLHDMGALKAAIKVGETEMHAALVEKGIL